MSTRSEYYQRRFHGDKSPGQIWVKDRHKNTGFFQAMAKAHRRKNWISKLEGNEWITEKQ